MISIVVWLYSKYNEESCCLMEIRWQYIYANVFSLYSYFAFGHVWNWRCSAFTEAVGLWCRILDVQKYEINIKTTDFIMDIHLSTCTLKVNSLNILIQFRMQQAFMNVKIGAREKSETYKISTEKKHSRIDYFCTLSCVRYWCWWLHKDEIICLTDL